MDGRNLPDCSQLHDVFDSDKHGPIIHPLRRQAPHWSFRVQQTFKQLLNGLISLLQVGACQCPHPRVAQGQSSGLSHRQRSSTTYSLAQWVPRWRFFWSVYSSFSAQKNKVRFVAFLMQETVDHCWPLPSKGRKPHAQQCVKACPHIKGQLGGPQSILFFLIGTGLVEIGSCFSAVLVAKQSTPKQSQDDRLDFIPWPQRRTGSCVLPIRLWLVGSAQRLSKYPNLSCQSTRPEGNCSTSNSFSLFGIQNGLRGLALADSNPDKKPTGPLASAVHPPDTSCTPAAYQLSDYSQKLVAQIAIAASGCIWS